MMSPLTELLRQLDRAWERLGVPDLPSGLAPGLPPDEVTQTLAAAGLSAPTEIVEWFGWHNGWSDSKGDFTRPVARYLLSLEAALDLAAVVHSSTEVDMRQWLPLDSDNLLVADLTADGVTVELHYVFWDDPQESAVVRSPSLATVVSVWLDLLANWPLTDDGFIDESQRPLTDELRDRGMLG